MSLRIVISKKSGQAFIYCIECEKTGPADEWAYGHDCEAE